MGMAPYPCLHGHEILAEGTDEDRLVPPGMAVELHALKPKSRLLGVDSHVALALRAAMRRAIASDLCNPAVNFPLAS